MIHLFPDTHRCYWYVVLILVMSHGSFYVSFPHPPSLNTQVYVVSQLSRSDNFIGWEYLFSMLHHIFPSHPTHPWYSVSWVGVTIVLVGSTYSPCFIPSSHPIPSIHGIVSWVGVTILLVGCFILSSHPIPSIHYVVSQFYWLGVHLLHAPSYLLILSHPSMQFSLIG